VGVSVGKACAAPVASTARYAGSQGATPGKAPTTPSNVVHAMAVDASMAPTPTSSDFDMATT
jgi:hypothetical protein